MAKRVSEVREDCSDTHTLLYRRVCYAIASRGENLNASSAMRKCAGVCVVSNVQCQAMDSQSGKYGCGDCCCPTLSAPREQICACAVRVGACAVRVGACAVRVGACACTLFVLVRRGLRRLELSTRCEAWVRSHRRSIRVRHRRG